MTTAIEWTDAVWNPVTGCSKVSEGCRNCYAFALHDMRHKAYLEGKKLPAQYAKPFSEIQLFPDRLEQPLRWKKPRRIFVNSMSDLFHESVPDDFIEKVFKIMCVADRHTYQVLTKRPDRMQWWFQHYAWNLTHTPHIWLGTSVENQKAADERIPLLLQTPAAVRFLSCEPLLGPVDLTNYLPYQYQATDEWGSFTDVYEQPGVDWIIVGGESGPGARPMHPDWVRSLRDQCQATGVSFFFKQWGEWLFVHPDRKSYEYSSPETKCANIDGMRFYRVGKKKAGRQLDGQEWNQFPGGERDASRT